MPNIFDLTKIKRLVEEKHPPAILIVDTNVLMNEPDFSKWGTSVGKPIFVLPAMIHIELEHLKEKPEPTKGKAIKAIKSVNNLFNKQGTITITDGIVIEDVGYFISIPTPKADQINPELEQLDVIVKAFHRSDAEFLLLTRECNQFIPNIFTFFVTSDKSLYNIMEGNGIPSYMFESFPMSGIKEVIEKSLRKPLDWDSELAKAQETIKRRSVEVELTLTSKKCMPKWLQGVGEYSQILLAEGYGIIHSRKDGEIRFLWSLPFEPRDLTSETTTTQSIGIDYLNTAQVDFLGYDEEITKQFRGILVEKISACASPFAFSDGTPTVQDTFSVMLTFLYYDCPSLQIEETGRELYDENQFLNEINKQGGLVGYCNYWFVKRDDELDKYISLEGFIDALKSCWSLGETVTIKIIHQSSKLEREH